jgi:hypothetical protein
MFLCSNAIAHAQYQLGLGLSSASITGDTTAQPLFTSMVLALSLTNGPRAMVQLAIGAATRIAQGVLV